MRSSRWQGERSRDEEFLKPGSAMRYAMRTKSSKATAVVRLRNSAAQSVAREKLVRVVFEETEDKYIVITAYLTSDIKRYWKDKAP